MTIVAIHQPNFLPWLGFFDKIARVDYFIILDDVQMPKKGGVWTNRVKILVQNQSKWLTVPIERNFHGVRKISEIQINDNSSWREQMLKTIEYNYKKAPYFSEEFKNIQEIISYQARSLGEYNINGIQRLLDRLKIDSSKLSRSSDLKVDSLGTQRLIDLTKAVGGTVYLCGGGAQGYQDDDLFAKAGIKLVYQNFIHPIYEQSQTPHDFASGLSVIDALFHLGCKKVSKLFSE